MKSKQPGWTRCASVGETCFAPSSRCSKERHREPSQVSFWRPCSTAKCCPSTSTDKQQIPPQGSGKAVFVWSRGTDTDLRLLTEYAETGALTRHCTVLRGGRTCPFVCSQCRAHFLMMPVSACWAPAAPQAAQLCCGSWLLKLDQTLCKKRLCYTTAVRTHSNIYTQTGNHFVCWWKYPFPPYTRPVPCNTEVKLGIIQGTGIA